MKRTLCQPLTVGLAALLLALPAYAENTQAPDASAAPVAQSAPAQKEENRLAPYLGKKITKQIIKGNVAISEEEIAAALKTKQGMEFTEEGLNQDLSAIYDLGWFYDMRPEFKLVPEGVQIIYHVLENPVYKD
ncbi:MAG: POTRA domain-containing protein [Phascolarctobacterium sp.]|nr:POTRA domain-containing protein [Phascolarctobacterium sp.]